MVKHLVTYLVTHLVTYLVTHLITYLVTHLAPYLVTHLLTVMLVTPGYAPGHRPVCIWSHILSQTFLSDIWLYYGTYTWLFIWSRTWSHTWSSIWSNTWSRTWQVCDARNLTICSGLQIASLPRPTAATRTSNGDLLDPRRSRQSMEVSVLFADQIGLSSFPIFSFAIREHYFFFSTFRGATFLDGFGRWVSIKQTRISLSKEGGGTGGEERCVCVCSFSP